MAKTQIPNHTRLPLLMAGLALVTACAGPNNKPYDEASYRAERAAETAAVAEYERCNKNALALDSSAAAQGSMAQYHSAAGAFESCLQELFPRQDAVPEQQRMQAHALSIIDYLKGGDVARAQDQMAAFEMRFPGKDLYFADYSSFLDSMQLLLGAAAQPAPQDAVLNVNKTLSGELRRNAYWQSH